MEYTVILYHPNWQGERSAADRVARVYVNNCVDPDHAFEAAQYQAASRYQLSAADFEVVAVYQDHIFDLFTP